MYRKEQCIRNSLIVTAGALITVVITSSTKTRDYKLDRIYKTVFISILM